MTQKSTKSLTHAIDDEAASKLIDAMLPVLSLEIAEAWRAPVITNLQANAGFAALVLEFPLPDDEEPAPVFRP